MWYEQKVIIKKINFIFNLTAKTVITFKTQSNLHAKKTARQEKAIKSADCAGGHGDEDEDEGNGGYKKMAWNCLRDLICWVGSNLQVCHWCIVLMGLGSQRH